MTRDDIERIAREAGIKIEIDWAGRPSTIVIRDGATYLRGVHELERFAALVAAAEREKVAAWMRSKSYATGHGDTIEDLLKELEWQVAEREREACAKVCDARVIGDHNREDQEAKRCAAAIRARGNHES